MSDDPRDEIDEEEVRSRVAYALLVPVARFATTFRLPLAPMKKWLETAYFHELRRRGYEVKDAVDAMSISISKAALLSKQLKQNFLTAEHELPRRIEYMLWAEPLSAARLNQVLPDVDEDEVDAAIEKLLTEERIEADGDSDRYRLSITESRRVWDQWLARLDGLNRAMASVADAVFARFFDQDDSAFSRTVTFHVRDDDIPRMRKLYEKQVFPLLSELNQSAEDAEGDPVTLLSFSIFWAAADASVDTPEQGDE